MSNWNSCRYRGTGPALNDLMAGQIDIMIDQASNWINQIVWGELRRSQNLLKASA